MTAHVVFVHGVANREDSIYKKGVANRDELFRKLIFGETAEIKNPYWGQFGANPSGGQYLSLPDYGNPTAGNVETLGLDLRPEQGEAPRLIDLAREDFPETVDIIFDGVFEKAQEGDTSNLPEEALLLARRAAEYAINVPNPQWLAADLGDDEFLKRLEQTSTQFALSTTQAAAAAEVETLGIGSWLKDGATAVINRVRNAGGRVALAAGREAAHTQIARFIGDIFRYLKDGAGRAPIRELIHDALKEAVDSGDPIVLIGHSLGGVILVDCLGDQAFCDSVGLKDGRKVKALVTVGSQPGFFQELDLLGMQKPALLPVVETWFNVFDELDILSFLAGTTFEGNIKDMMFSSRTGILDSHTAYFTRVQFYARLRNRLQEAGVPVVNPS